MSNLEKLTALRALLIENELDGWLVPRSDEHQGEYVAPYAERLNWATGFDGSAGMAIVLKDSAAIFVDGRYTLQAKNQVDESLFEIVPTAEVSITEWMHNHLAGLKIGFDPWLHTENEINRYASACAGLKTELIAMDGNFIDDVWHDQPGLPMARAHVHEDCFTGESSAAKCLRLGMELTSRKIDAAVLTNLDSIAWLLNFRGSDIPCTPVALAFAVLHANGKTDLYIDKSKLSDRLGSDVRIYDYQDFYHFQDGFKGRRVLLDPKTAPVQIMYNLQLVGAEVVRSDDICMYSKACKNETELNGMRASHIRDGAALSEFMAWLSSRMQTKEICELEASDTLKSFRARKEHFRGLSFETISGSGPNGAIVHYRVTPESSRKLNQSEIFLLDSGAQYLDGTTDVTRTLAFSAPTDEQKDRFTRVLKGHIAIATAIFPKGTTGAQLDVLARKSLWDAGLDYQHGTGHGVGCYLCVHEGPQRIAKGLALDIPLRKGMILSNEPGYYKEGEYGIRIESLIIVKPYNESFLCFETITMAPICLDLVDVTMLTEHERNWLNSYHQAVRKNLSDHVSSDVAANVNDWLTHQTRAI